MSEFDVIVVGAGAAGLFAAKTAGLRGKRVLLLDHASKLGLKILISGGGRCNFTNLNTTALDFASQNPHFCKSALSQFTPQDFLALVHKHGIAYHHKTPGQLFCDHSSKEILQMLLTECRQAQVEMRFPVQISNVKYIDKKFFIETSIGSLQAASLIVASGGISFAKLGATPFGYELAKQFGHAIVPPMPALCGFAVDGELFRVCQKLSGLTLPVCVKIHKKNFADGLVFTHFGLSGPALLNASLFWQQGDSIHIDFLCERDLTAHLLHLKQNHSRLMWRNACKGFYPERFIDAWSELQNIPATEVHQIQISDLKNFARRLQSLTFVPPRTAGFERAEVTRGGVSVEKISSKTLESQLVPGLFFAGEVVDVTGRLGGFNFQWAWASGFVAGSQC